MSSGGGCSVGRAGTAQRAPRAPRAPAGAESEHTHPSEGAGSPVRGATLPEGVRAGVGAGPDPGPRGSAHRGKRRGRGRDREGSVAGTALATAAWTAALTRPVRGEPRTPGGPSVLSKCHHTRESLRMGITLVATRPSVTGSGVANGTASRVGPCRPHGRGLRVSVCTP